MINKEETLSLLSKYRELENHIKDVVLPISEKVYEYGTSFMYRGIEYINIKENEFYIKSFEYNGGWGNYYSLEETIPIDYLFLSEDELTKQLEIDIKAEKEKELEKERLEREEQEEIKKRRDYQRYLKLKEEFENEN
jgi:hypothetical protein